MIKRLFLLSSLLALPAAGESLPPEATDPDDDLFFLDKAWEINDGRLEFLAVAPETPLHHHWNQITITEASLDDGWIELYQCHENLDTVPDLVIIYGKEKTRDIRISETANIENARVEGNRIVLQNVGDGSRLCLTAAMRSLEKLAEGGYTLNNGPYLRRFLDGYFPLHLTLEIYYPPARLRFVDIAPPAQAGFEVKLGAGFIKVEALFAGRLQTQLRFALL